MGAEEAVAEEPRVATFPMFLKLLTYSAAWIALGFAAGSMIWLGLILARHKARRSRGASESQDRPSLGREKVATTYRILDGGKADALQVGDAPARRKHGTRELLNFPR